MIKKLLILGLIIVPFYEVFLYFLIPYRDFPQFPDMRVTKDFVSMAISLALGSIVLYKYGFKKVKNIWILAFVFFLVWNIFKSPETGIAVNRMWNYEPVLMVLVNFILFLGVSSVEFSRKDIKDIFATIMYCGLGMAIIIVCQRIGLDQIFHILPKYITLGTNLPLVGGTLGQATLSAPFIVMCIPFAIYFKKWLIGAIMAVSVVLTESMVAIGGMGIGLIIYILFIEKWWKYALLVGVIGAIGVLIYLKPDLLVQNSRLYAWKLAIKDIFTGKIAFTGAGIGAFKFLFALRHNNSWYHLHNDWLQLIWGCGLIGFWIAFMAIKKILAEAWRFRPIFIAFCSVIAIAMGTFILQLAAYQYYLTIMVGIIYSCKKEIYYESTANAS